MQGENTLSILGRLVDASLGNLSLAAARAILEFRLSEADQARVEELAQRSTAGTLSAAEASEYDAYLATADVLSVWKSQARLVLQRSSAA